MLPKEAQTLDVQEIWDDYPEWEEAVPKPDLPPEGGDSGGDTSGDGSGGDVA
jgi:hypothetical protein